MRTYQFEIKHPVTKEIRTISTLAKNKKEAIAQMNKRIIECNGLYNWKVIKSSFKWVD